MTGLASLSKNVDRGKKRAQNRSLVFFNSLSAYLELGIQQVHGWLERTSATMIAHLAVEQVQAGLAGDVAEIGVHHGKLFILLANATSSAETARAVDFFQTSKKMWIILALVIG